MKQGTLATKLVMFVLFAAVVVYLVFYMVNGLMDPFETAEAYTYTVDDGVQVTGYLVRQETPLSGGGSLVSFLAAEGEKVAVGQAVAKVFQDAAALEREGEIQDLNRQISQIQYIAGRSQSSADTMELDEAIVTAITNVRGAVARQDLTGLSALTEELKSQIFRREYTYNGEVDLTEALTALNQQVQALRSQAASDTSTVRVSQSGTFSCLVDGFEEVLTPELLDTLTPSGFDALGEGQAAVTEGASLGKLITSHTWYFAAVVDEAVAARMRGTVTLRFSTDYSGEISMNVERISDPEDGRVLVVLSTDKYLEQTTMIRRQTVEMIYQSTTGIRVAKQAVRMDKEGNLGVFAVTGLQAEWKPVNILWEGESFYLVEAGDPAASAAIHPGDEIIVRGTDLYDGKVIA